MPVDRSLLPPLPGKPDWYVERAPAASEQPIDPGPAAVRTTLWPAQVDPPPAANPPASSLDTFLPEHAAPAAPRRRSRVRSLAGRLRH